MISNHPPPIVGGRRVKPRYITQLKSRPPTFVMAGNKLEDLPESYVRFLTNGLRKAFGLKGVPIRWILKKSDNPFGDKKKK
jgi:GTP-binding protein